ncbi:hypothetical protein JCM8115_001609 [Rhodotorula mucilaginosa]|uniref:DUF3752 domain-containing protein n=1 Tax=Rhodotorula mucilaginosa TaxID=5537 RepID=A0A9P7B202_RHOMI|nr:hypothetical protein C6P46_001154 [Rhodotorula mucilaginosa]TKA55769.1 hypothetical protein B0A53_02905 [Rhodotorula sp. CCFEE 5036]
MTIGPQLPPHLAQSREPNADAEAGPAAPPRDDDGDEDDFGPALPPDMQQDRKRLSHAEQSPTAVAGPQLPPHLAHTTPAVCGPSLPTLGPTLPPRRAVGPSRPPYGTAEDGEDDSDGEVGPLPPPVGQQVDDDAGVRLFREREERERRKQQEEAENKKPKREEWMLVPPKEMDLLSSMDTTKLKSRGFATGKAAQRASGSDSSSGVNLWTETPAERQERLRDEMLGKKRKAENAPAEEETDEARRKRLRDQQLKDEVERHNRTQRSESLLDKHAKASRASGKDVDDRAPTAIWDRDRDMSLGGRLMDDSQRSSVVKNAKGLGGRFGGGSFL